MRGRLPGPAGDKKKQRGRLVDGKVRGRRFETTGGVGGRQPAELAMGSRITIAAREISEC